MSPPFFIVSITIFQIAIFLYYDLAARNEKQTITSLLIESPLIFDPSKRYQIWRYFTYILVHIDWSHLFFNLSMQIILGFPLELNHTWRVVVVYVLGCLSGNYIALNFF